jgi:2'-5' RNA ligase
MKLCIVADIPSEFTAFFPKDRGGDDSSNPHITVLYVGEIDNKNITKAIDVIDSVVREMKPIKCEFGDIKSFPNGDDGVPHYVEIIADKGLKELHHLLQSKLESAGVPAPQKYKDYKAHATLKYLPEGEDYKGKAPTGEFMINNITSSIFGDDV